MSDKTQRLRRILVSVPVLASLLLPQLAAAGPEPTTPPVDAKGPLLNEPVDSMKQWRALIEFREALIADPELRHALFHDTAAASPIIEKRIYEQLKADGADEKQALEQVAMVSQVLKEIVSLKPEERQIVFDAIQSEEALNASFVAGVVAAVAVVLAVKVAVAVQSAAAIQAVAAIANIWVNVWGTGDDGPGADEKGEGAEEQGDLNEDDWTDDDFGSSGDSDILDGDEFGGDDVIIEGPTAFNGYPSEPGVSVDDSVLVAFSEAFDHLADYRQRTLLRRILSSTDALVSKSRKGGIRTAKYEYRSRTLSVSAKYDRRRNVFHVTKVTVA